MAIGWEALLLAMGVGVSVGILFVSRHREQTYAAQLEQLEQKSGMLSRLLAKRQNFEQLLIASMEHSMRQVSYENLLQVMEELVDAWFARLDFLVSLRLSLESSDGLVYCEVRRGDAASEQKTYTVREHVVVDEQLDTPLAPRYVRVEAMIPSDVSAERELEHSIFQLLAINVRGLILRCLHENQSMQLRLMEQEMELAAKIQFSLIPKERLVLAQLEARAVFLPVMYVGGDYIDFFQIDERHTCFLVADVSGHGLPASLLTTGIRSAMRAVIQTCVSPEQILQRLNRLLYDDLSTTRSYITMLVAVYDAVEAKLFISRAGHPQPLYLSAGRPSFVECPGGVGLGLAADSEYAREEFLLEEDGVLLIYTDGLLELGRRENPRDSRQWLGDCFAALLQNRTPEEDWIAAIEEHIWQLTKKHKQTDDISLLILAGKANRAGKEVET